MKGKTPKYGEYLKIVSTILRYSPYFEIFISFYHIISAQIYVDIIDSFFEILFKFKIFLNKHEKIVYEIRVIDVLYWIEFLFFDFQVQMNERESRRCQLTLNSLQGVPEDVSL